MSQAQKTIFHCDFEKQREDGAALATESKRVSGRKRQSYQHMAASDSLKKAGSHESHVHEETWTAHRIGLLRVLSSPWYSVGIGIVILLNTLLVIHEVDSLSSGPGVPGWVTIAAGIFLAIYILEIVLRFYVFRLKFFQNAWNLLDLTVVITDLCAEIASMGGLNNLPSMSALRIFRLVRLVRLIAMLSVFPELQTMLLGFGSAMKAIVWASLMIGVVITVCSICAVIFIHPLNVQVAETGVYKDCERCGRAFETVAESNLTFIQQIIAGDSWGQVTIPIIEAYPLAGAFFLLVFGVIDLGVINLVLMVIVNAAETAREANQDMQFRKKVGEIQETKQKLKNLCKELDANDDGRISLAEFMEGLDKNEDLARAMAGLDVQRQDAEIMFYLMDEDKSGDVDFHEFIGTLIATQHESVTTKLLFLKASIHQIFKDLTIQGQVLQDDVVPMVRTQQVAEVMKTIHDEASSKINLQCKEIMSECQSLAQKLDQRWQQLQVEQAKTCNTLEQVVGEINQLQSEAQCYARESTLLNLSLPAAGAPGKVEEANRPRGCAFLCNPSEPGSSLRRLPLLPAGRDDHLFGNDHLQNGLVLAQSALSGSKSAAVAK